MLFLGAAVILFIIFPFQFDKHRNEQYSRFTFDFIISDKKKGTYEYVGEHMTFWYHLAGQLDRMNCKYVNVQQINEMPRRTEYFFQTHKVVWVPRQLKYIFQYFISTKCSPTFLDPPTFSIAQNGFTPSAVIASGFPLRTSTSTSTSKCKRPGECDRVIELYANTSTWPLKCGNLSVTNNDFTPLQRITNDGNGDGNGDGIYDSILWLGIWTDLLNFAVTEEEEEEEEEGFFSLRIESGEKCANCARVSVPERINLNSAFSWLIEFASVYLSCSLAAPFKPTIPMTNFIWLQFARKPKRRHAKTAKGGGGIHREYLLTIQIFIRLVFDLLSGYRYIFIKKNAKR